jgi:DNA invertase Pin-like site-specific DNA recombinase
MALLGYARVSTQDQNLTRQLDALKGAGATTIYREKVSGARADRPQLTKLMAALKPGDVVVVTKLAATIAKSYGVAISMVSRL